MNQFIDGLSFSYETNGVTVVSAKMHSDFDAIVFQYDYDDTEPPVRLVFCKGRLTRAERRKIVKAALLAFKFDVLREPEIEMAEAIGKCKMPADKVRYCFFNFVESEVSK